MSNQIYITEEIFIQEEELQYKALTSSGPGGQHVNKTQTAVQLRFNIIESPSLSYGVQQRLIYLAGSRVTHHFELVLTARNHRSQSRNKREVTERLFDLIRKAAVKPKPRLKRRRSRKENRTRLEKKQRQSQRKNLRKKLKPGQDI